LSGGVSPRVIGHRGAAGSAPENTLAGFRRAAELGCQWVEFDVQLSADGVPILLHDSRLNRTSSGRGRAARLTLAELKKLDAGSWFGAEFSGERILTLAEALQEIARLGLIPNIEIKAARSKAAEVARVVLRLAREVWPKSAPLPLVSSFAPEALVEAARICPDWPRGYLAARFSLFAMKEAKQLGCTFFNLSAKHIKATQITKLCNAGFYVLAYTVNDKIEATRLFTLGVKGVFSDLPDEILCLEGDSG
jgi:glycerophosphoryl diester phosphodiesterase